MYPVVFAAEAVRDTLDLSTTRKHKDMAQQHQT